MLKREQRINPSKETIELAGTSSIEADALASTISDSEPRYSFYRFSHDFEGQNESPVVLIYTCPGGSKIKERMLYASSRSGMVSAASSDAGLTIAKKVHDDHIDIAYGSLTDFYIRWRPRAHRRSLRRLYTKNCIRSKSKSKAFQDPRGLGNDDEPIGKLELIRL